MRQLGYNTGIKTRRPNFVSNMYSMGSKKTKNDKGKEGDEKLLKTCNLRSV
jgi:hypothetical protein